MAKTKISEYSTTAGNNTDINSINIAEGCAPSGINDAIRELMRQLKEFQTGGAGDSVNSGGDFSVATNKFTVASATGNTAVAGTLGATGDFAINTDKFTVTASSGNTAVAGTLASTGNFAVNTDKFTVTAASGNTSVAGTLGAAGNFAVNTDKFTVAASSGNTAVAGTFAVTGATTLTGALVANGNSTLGDADTDTVTLNASFVNGTTLKTAKTATNTLALAAYDVDGTAYTNLVTLTAGNTPSLALTSTAVGTINNMSIGATTASTGAFTTLSASSDVTLSGGTANGVLYLNGSKVATSGSALVFDGTNLGVGTNSPLGKLDARGDLYVGANARILITEGGTGDAVIGGRAGTAFLALTVNGSEQARLTSTGLGIGTSSPGYKLDIVTANNTKGLQISGATTGYSYATINNTTTKVVLGVTDSTGTLFSTKLSSTYHIGLGTDNGYGLAFATNDVERVFLDSSGNLGLGVTPSAWGSSWKALQVGGGSLWANPSSASNTLHLTRNAYYDGTSYKYIATGTASNYDQDSGSHSWFTAPSGTAGNAITFTQAMTLDASGNLMLGVTSTTYPFDVNGTSSTAANSSATGSSTRLRNIYTRSRANSAGISGDLYADQLFHVSGGSNFEIYNADNFSLVFGTNATERARIDSSGNLLCGATTNPVGAGAKLTAVHTGAYYAGSFVNDNKDYQTILVWNKGTTGTRYLMEFGTTATYSAKGSITTDGTNTAYNTSSDYRLKNITGPISNSGSYIDSLNPVEGTWKENGSVFVGLIAHEVQEVSRTSIVTGEKDGEKMQSMDYSSAEIIANLIAEVKSLRARVAALES